MYAITKTEEDALERLAYAIVAEATQGYEWLPKHMLEELRTELVSELVCIPEERTRLMRIVRRDRVMN
jgi:hypothetical protein